MKSFLKLFISFLLTVCLGVATVICCCFAPAVMAHFHKVSMCRHCPSQGPSHGHSSGPTDNCLYRLSNAEIFHGQIVISAAPAVFIHYIFFDKHLATPFLPSLVQAYPRGSPPLPASFTPLYLRTFHLRI